MVDSRFPVLPLLCLKTATDHTTVDIVQEKNTVIGKKRIRTVWVVHATKATTL